MRPCVSSLNRASSFTQPAERRGRAAKRRSPSAPPVLHSMPLRRPILNLLTSFPRPEERAASALSQLTIPHLPTETWLEICSHLDCHSLAKVQRMHHLRMSDSERDAHLGFLAQEWGFKDKPPLLSWARYLESLEEEQEESTHDGVLLSVLDGALFGPHGVQQFPRSRSIILAATPRHSDALRSADAALRDDPAFVSQVVKHNVYAIAYASPRVRDDEAIMRPVIARSPQLIRYASPRLRADKGFVTVAVSGDGRALEHADANLRDDFETVMRAVLSDGMALRWASEAIRKDPRIVAAATRNNGCNIQFADADLRGNRAFALGIVAGGPSVVHHVVDALAYDRSFLVEAMRINPQALRYVKQDMRDDVEVVREAVRMDPETLRYASWRLRNDASFRASCELANASA